MIKVNRALDVTPRTLDGRRRLNKTDFFNLVRHAPAFFVEP